VTAPCAEEGAGYVPTPSSAQIKAVLLNLRELKKAGRV
jgi:hypothetical protein